MTPPATHCGTCGADATDLPGAGPVIHHLPSCRAEYDRIAQAAMNTYYAYQEVVEAIRRSSVDSADALEAADVLAETVPPLVGYAGRLMRQSAQAQYATTNEAITVTDETGRILRYGP